jgi:uncharacterized membrane protein YfcA
MRLYKFISLYHFILYITIIFYGFKVKILLVIILTKQKTNYSSLLYGVIIGLVNGVFGAGGGMIAVPVLKKQGLDQKLAHANAVAVILPITIISAVLYLVKGNVTLIDSWAFIPTGLIGSVIATLALQKFSNKVLQKTFAAFMIYAGVRLLMQ